MFVTLDDPYHDSLTVVKRIRSRDTNLYKIYLTNDISRKLCEGQLTLKQANYELKRLPRSLYTRWLRYASVPVISAAFALIFGGNHMDADVYKRQVIPCIRKLSSRNLWPPLWRKYGIKKTTLRLPRCPRLISVSYTHLLWDPREPSASRRILSEK